MAKYSNTVEYNIRTTIDQTGLAQLQSSLSALDSQIRVMGGRRFISEASKQQALKDIKIVQNALNTAFNPKLGMLNTKTFMSELAKEGRSLQNIFDSWSGAGAKGISTFNSMYSQIMKIDTGLKRISSVSDKIVNTIGNTVRWGLIASVFARIMNSAHESVEYVKELDKSLTNIMMVSGESKENMNQFAKYANEAAKRLGATTTQMTEAAKVFVQQGMNTTESLQMGEYAVHLANISEQNSSITSDELTAMKNAFKINIDDMGNAISKWAVIANNTAVDMEELSVASQKAASVATTVGVDMEQFAGHIAAIEATTREAPENIGNGLKTLYSRIADIKLGETLEDGVDLGQFSGALEKVGVQVLDAEGKMRDAGTIIEDLMVRWQSLDQTERNAVATTVAGRFQLARFEALMNSQDIYRTAVNASRAETGTETYDRMQEDYRNSLEGRTKALQASIENIFLNAFNTDDFYSFIDALTTATDVIGDLVKAIGGGTSAFTAFAAIATKLFSSKIGEGISNFVTNRQTKQLEKETAAEQISIAKNQLIGRGVNTDNASTQQYLNSVATAMSKRNNYSAEDIQIVNEKLEKYHQIIQELVPAEEQFEQTIMTVKYALEALGISGETAEMGLESMLAMLEEDSLGFEKGTVDIEKFEKGLGSLKSLLGNTTDLINSLGIAFEKEAAGSETAGAAWEIAQKRAENLQRALEKNRNVFTQTAESTKNFEQTLKILDTITDGNTRSLEQVVAATGKTRQEILQLIQGLERFLKVGKLTTDDIKQMAAQLRGLQSAANVTGKELQGMAEKGSIQGLAQGITSFASGVTTVVFAVQAFKSAMEVLSSDELDPFEKLEQGALNFGMVLSLAIPQIIQLVNFIREFSAAAGEAALAQQAQTLAQKGSIMASQEGSAALASAIGLQNAATLATQAQANATREEMMATLQDSLTKKEYTRTEVAAIAATSGLTAAEVEEAIAAAGGTVATRGFAAAMKDLAASSAAALAPLLPFIAIAGSVALVVGMVGLAVKQAYDEYHRFDTAVEENTKSLNKAKDAAKESKNSYDELVSSFDKINNAQKAFEGLTRGTKEWNQALLNANQQVLDLIDKYPVLAQYVSRDSATGALTISQEGQDALIAQKENEVKARQLAVLQQQEALAESKNTQGLVELIRDNTRDLKDFRSAAMEMTTTALQDTANGGTYYVEALAYSEEKFAKDLQGIAEIITNAGVKNAEEAKAVLKNTEYAAYGDLITSDNYTDLLAAIDSVSESLSNLAAISDATVSSLIGTTEGYQNASYSDQIIMNDYVKEAMLNRNNSLYDAASKQFEQQFGGWNPEQLLKYIEDNNISVAGYSRDEKGQWSKDGKEIERKSVQFDDMKKAIVDGFIIGGEESATLIKNSIEEAANNFAAELAKEENKTIGYGDNFDYQTDEYGQLKEEDQAVYQEQEARILSLVKNLDMLNEAYGVSKLTQDGYGKGLIQLAQRYGGLDDKITEVTKATEEYKDAIKNNKGETEKTKALRKLTGAQEELERSIIHVDWEKAGENAAQYVKILNEAEKGTEEYNSAASNIAEILGNVMDIPVNTQFVEDNLGLINDWVNGSEAAASQIKATLSLASADGQAYMAQAAEYAAQAAGFVQGTWEGVSGAVQSLSFDVNGSADFNQVFEQLGLLNESAAITDEQLMALASILAALGASELTLGVDESGTPISVDASGLSSATTPEEYADAVNKFIASYRAAIESVGSMGIHASAYVPAGAPSVPMQSVGSPSSGGDSGGGGGGGGGGGDNAEEPKDVAHQDAGDAELDIYKKIDAWLERLKDNYSKLNKVRSRTWSRDAVKMANQELGLLRSQGQALQEKLNIAQEYQQALLGDEALKNKYNVKNSLNEYGLTDSDLDGIVDNYAQQWRIAKELADKAQQEADDYFRAHGGDTGKDQYGNTVVIKDAQMLEEEANHYDELVETAKNALNIVNQIDEVTNSYQDTSDTIRDIQEEQLDILQQMEDIQIELYQASIETLDTLKDIHDTMRDIQGMWSGFELDSPFRAMVQDVQEIEDFFSGNSRQEIKDYYDNILNTIDQRKDLNEQERKQAKEFFQQERANALSSQGYNNLGFGELADASRKLAELQAMETNEAVRKLVYGTNTKQWQEDFEEQAKKVQELALEVEEAWKTAQENIVDALDEEADKLDKLYDKYNQITEDLDREAERVALLYGDDQYADLNKLATASGKAYLETAKKYKQEYDYWANKQNAIAAQEEEERNRRIAEAKQVAAKAATDQEKAEAALLLEQAKQYHSDEWEWYESRMQEAMENAKNAQDESARQFQKAYEYAIDEIEAKWLESALGTRDTNYLLDDWNRDKDFMTTYKDDFERQYEIEKLNYKWQQMLNDSLGSSLAIQRKIKNEGQQILDQLAGQTTMSEYDVKLANAKLEVLQKQIALENAQQNKNQMKLRRDSQGNYKYVYAADQDDVLGKQQDLLDSIYDVWEISKTQSIDSTTNYIEAVQQAGEQAKAIWNDASLTIEQKQALIAALIADTGRLLEAISEDAGDSFDGMISAVVLGSGIGLQNVQEMCANVLEALETHNEEAIEAIGVPWDNELQSKMEQISEIEQSFANLMDNCAEANASFLDEIQNPVTGVAAVMGEAYGSATNAIDTATKATNDLYNETLKLYTLFGVESNALDQAKKTLIEYRDLLDAATSGSGALAAQINKANEQIIANAKASGNWITAPTATDKTAEGYANPNAISVAKVSSSYTPQARSIGSSLASGGGGSGSGGGGGRGGGGTTSRPRTTSQPKTTSTTTTQQDDYFVGDGGYVFGYYNGAYLWPFSGATGGYTGSWSDNGIDEKGGKWAILHQKELVLNAADTQNILAAVDMVRTMTDKLKTASLTTLGEGFKNAQSNASNDTIEQRVEIIAEFPNANSADEIKQALLGLSDSAMQYAYRER